MATAILPAAQVADSLRRKRFRRSEVDRMLELGILDGQRCELIDGELIEKLGQNPPHAQAIGISSPGCQRSSLRSNYRCNCRSK
jgi:hypothetical protein